MVFLGLLIGLLVTVMNVIFVKGEMRPFTCGAFMFGGAFGGVLAALCMSPFDGISRRDIVLIALAGYFFADLAATLATGGVRKC